VQSYTALKPPDGHFVPIGYNYFNLISYFFNIRYNHSDNYNFYLHQVILNLKMWIKQPLIYPEMNFE
jgi:hypothetical protein